MVAGGTPRAVVVPAAPRCVADRPQLLRSAAALPGGPGRPRTPSPGEGLRPGGATGAFAGDRRGAGELRQTSGSAGLSRRWDALRRLRGPSRHARRAAGPSHSPVSLVAPSQPGIRGSRCRHSGGMGSHPRVALSRCFGRVFLSFLRSLPTQRRSRSRTPLPACGRWGTVRKSCLAAVIGRRS